MTSNHSNYIRRFPTTESGRGAMELHLSDETLEKLRKRDVSAHSIDWSSVKITFKQMRIGRKLKPGQRSKQPRMQGREKNLDFDIYVDGEASGVSLRHEEEDYAKSRKHKEGWYIKDAGGRWESIGYNEYL